MGCLSGGGDWGRKDCTIKLSKKKQKTKYVNINILWLNITRKSFRINRKKTFAETSYMVYCERVKMKLHHYKTAGDKDLILEFIDNLPVVERAAGLVALEKLQDDSAEAMTILCTRHIQGKLWEIKFYKANRIFYILLDKDNIYLVHACKKQKGKAEKFELQKAIRRAKELNANAI